MKETLLYLRELNNYSQSFVASYLNISRQMYSKYENGDVDPGVKSVIALCKLYKVDYEVLLENQLNKTSGEKKKSEYPKGSVEYKIETDFGIPWKVACPQPTYSSSAQEMKTTEYYYNKVLGYLPKLTLAESLSLLQKVAHKIEVLTQKNELKTKKNDLSEKEAKELFEYFTGKGKGLDFEEEKSKYLTEKHLKSDNL